ncbi:unnamed protein product, partial [Hapterophycus canaliculatus]
SCQVCLDCAVNCTLVPCGHHCLCVRCAANLNECPVCRTVITSRVKTYRA